MITMMAWYIVNLAIADFSPLSFELIQKFEYVLHEAKLSVRACPCVCVGGGNLACKKKKSYSS